MPFGTSAKQGALNTKLTENKESAYFSKQLATIDVNVPLKISLNECVLKMPFPYPLREKFAELEFKSLLTKNIFEEQQEVDTITEEEEEN